MPGVVATTLLPFSRRGGSPFGFNYDNSALAGNEFIILYWSSGKLINCQSFRAVVAPFVVVVIVVPFAPFVVVNIFMFWRN